MSEFSLSGWATLITGGGRGIGAGIAQAFSEAGPAVALTARTESELEVDGGTVDELSPMFPDL